MGLRETVLLGLLVGVVSADYPYPSGKYPPAQPAGGAPNPGGSGPGPTGGAGPAPTGPSGPGPSGPGPSGPGPTGPVGGPGGFGGPFGPGPSGPGPFPFGPSGPGPWGPFGPFPWGPVGPVPFPPVPLPPVPFPPPPFGLAPYGSRGTVCAALERLRVRALRVTRPLLAGGIGAALLWMAKVLLIPNLAAVAGAVRRRVGIEDDSPLDRMASEVSRAISDGACVEKLACKIGKSTAQNYPAFKHIARIVDPKSTGFMENFTKAFQHYVSRDNEDCDALKCS